MIIGEDKGEVINNIKKAIEQGEYNKKVELGDPKLNSEEKNKIINKYLENRSRTSFKIKTKIAKNTISILTGILHKDTEIVGINNIKNIIGSGIITSNHFNPLDNLGRK